MVYMAVPSPIRAITGWSGARHSGTHGIEQPLADGATGEGDHVVAGCPGGQLAPWPARPFRGL
ncbi:hypothetical protein [Marinobacter similis]|uniref:hypothetical protein n=1 Tax=Marinobacter similis TaxID=1420916 RepID=UPI001F3FD032|nr:hypothetical protein [Marinobacter similis]